MSPASVLSGVLVVDKPAGRTSAQVVARARWLVAHASGSGAKPKIGHAGTLDPMATGVLVLGVGRATRLLGHLMLHDKRYLATIRLGASTTTDDAEGEVISRASATGLSDEQIREAMTPYRGEIAQVPSAVSAIKVDGQRAYARVRAGQDVELAARPVTIDRYDLLAVRREGDYCDLDVDVECSSGTYIRALARDLGRDLGVGGHLTRLRRTRVGTFGLADAVDLYASDDLPPLISMADAVAGSMPLVTVPGELAEAVSHGHAISVDVQASPTGIVGPDGDLIALYGPGQAPGVALPVAVLT